MKATFNYTSWPQNTWYPALTIKLINPKLMKGYQNYKAIIDTGAQSCIFHAGIGELIGLNIKKGEEKPFYGATEGEGKQYLHEVVLDIEQRWKIKCLIGFSYDLRFPFGLLGQDEFLSLFKASFDFANKKFDLNSNPIH
ncbi:MAG TPA: hypothetical protein VMW29_01480 [Candidatus Bathyarchaeia archaeon]|nr:hypothetical protein [Candidatus Bathyarchaeia archaeon]